VAGDVARVLADLDGGARVSVTMATTNILWVQEAFDPASDAFAEVVEIAGKWNAAVELVRFSAGPANVATDAAPAPPAREAAAVAGIEEDVAVEPPDAGGLKAALDELARLGKSGGGRIVTGERASLVASCCTAVPYSLVVLGQLFLDKGAAARLRLTRELQESIASRMRVPVVTADDLRTKYLFGRRDVVRLAASLLIVVALYALVFTNQAPVLRFLFGEWSDGGVLARATVAAAVFVVVPAVAYAYGSVARSLLKLIKME